MIFGEFVESLDSCTLTYRFYPVPLRAQLDVTQRRTFPQARSRPIIQRREGFS